MPMRVLITQRCDRINFLMKGDVMATTNEYAAFSAHVYNEQRGGGANALNNELPIPPGWKSLSDLGFAPGDNLNEWDMTR